MNYYNKIKEQLINNEITKRVKDYSKNRSDLNTYYNVGKLLVEAGKCYGESIIKLYSKRLTKDIGKGYSVRNLYNMKLFFEKVQTVSAKLSWSHYCEVLSITDVNKFNYYIKIADEQNLSVRELRSKIRSNEYERLSIKTKEKLKSREENKVTDFIKNPILIKHSYDYERITEKILKQLILEDMDNFLC